jgi:hypothetical protein
MWQLLSSHPRVSRLATVSEPDDRLYTPDSEPQTAVTWTPLGSTEEGLSESWSIRPETSIEAQASRASIVSTLREQSDELDVFDLIRLAAFIYDGRTDA